MTDIKICGLRQPDHIRIAASAGARFVGFVFFPKSPRHLVPDAVPSLVAATPENVTTTGLFVDPDDGLLQDVMARAPLGLIQLHGAEPPRRVAEIRARFGRPVMKALKIGGPEDLRDLATYEEVADWILFDAAPPKDSVLPGGNGAVFDWNILKAITLRRPWMLSGGLTAENVSEALKVLTPAAVDVSSGVEDAPGLKNPDKIKAFIRAVKEA